MLQFTLSMPNVGSWNGKWTGSEDFYAVVRSEKSAEVPIKHGDYFHYSFGDGWSAGVKVSVIDSATAQKIKRKSKGFCGYDWMVSSILKHGKIIST